MFSNGIINAVMEMFSLIVILCYMFAVNVKLTMISLIGLPVLILAIGLLKNIHRRAWQAYSNKNSNLNAYLHEDVYKRQHADRLAHPPLSAAAALFPLL